MVQAASPVKTASPKAAAPQKRAPAKQAKPATPPSRQAAPAKNKAAVKVTAPAASKAPAPAPVEVVKLKKSQLVRDSFTIPKEEYVAIDQLKLRSAKLGHPIKKSELMRAGLKALTALTDLQLKALLSTVPAIKTGRPKRVK